MNVFKTNHTNYQIVNNNDKPLPNFDVNEYVARTEKVYYNDPYLGYKGIVYTPIDLPKLDIDQNEMWEHWQWLADRYKNDETKKYSAELWFDKNPNIEHKHEIANHAMDYRMMRLMDKDAFTEYMFDGIWLEWKDRWFEKIKEHVLKLPFKHLRFCSIVGRDVHGVGPHYDDFHPFIPMLKLQDPCAIRIRLSKLQWQKREDVDWNKEHFYLTNTHGQTRLYPLLPPETNTMCYDATTNEHGGDKGYTPDIRVQVMPYGVLDEEKWHKLLDRSIEKYKDYVITTEHMKEVKEALK